MQDNEIQEQIDYATNNHSIDKIFIEAWNRGIGVHHSNYHTKYRSATEYLFRKQQVQIVFATETLALGVNMPCKTVVLTKDAIYLDSIMYRQMVGRAGRRGFDTIGNIVYFGLPKNKVASFISSDLIKLKGSFSYDLNNIMQFSTLSYFNNKNFSLLKSFVNYPISSLQGEAPIGNSELVRLQIIYLIKQGYLTNDFKPKRLTNLILPMRQENCNIFLISELLRNGVFEKITDPLAYFDDNCKRIVLALAYFTNPVFINPLLVESLQKDILLPKLPEVDDFIKQHNRKLDAFFNWAFQNDGSSSEALDERKSYYKKAFPYYENLPMNGYIYNFYVKGIISEIEKNNLIEQYDLWHGFIALKMLSATLLQCLRKFSSNKNLIKIVEACDKKISERFFLIKN